MSLPESQSHLPKRHSFANTKGEAMPRKSWANTIEVLSCDIGTRPVAPGVKELMPHVTMVRRERESLVIEYRPEARALVASFAAAEQVCCSTLRWELDEARPFLRITGTSAQLDALQAFFPSR